MAPVSAETTAGLSCDALLSCRGRRDRFSRAEVNSVSVRTVTRVLLPCKCCTNTFPGHCPLQSFESPCLAFLTLPRTSSRLFADVVCLLTLHVCFSRKPADLGRSLLSRLVSLSLLSPTGTGLRYFDKFRRVEGGSIAVSNCGHNWTATLWRKQTR